MTKKRTVLRVKQQTVRTQEPRLMNEIINDLLNGQTPFARARRHRSGRACTGQAGAGSACSGCTRSGQDGTGSAGAGSTWAESAGAGRAWIQGYGVAIYTNHGYEFKPRNPQPPQLPETNPVGVYQRDIEIPADWDGRDIFLRLEGAKSGVYVYVNGQEVGYSEDSKNPAEFLINNYLKPGKNSLVIKIFRWSTGSYVTDEDTVHHII